MTSCAVLAVMLAAATVVQARPMTEGPADVSGAGQRHLAQLVPMQQAGMIPQQQAGMIPQQQAGMLPQQMPQAGVMQPQVGGLPGPAINGVQPGVAGAAQGGPGIVGTGFAEPQIAALPRTEALNLEGGRMPIHRVIGQHIARVVPLDAHKQIVEHVQKVHKRNPDLYYIALFFAGVGVPILFYFVRAYNELQAQAASRITALHMQTEDLERAQEERLKEKEEATESWMEISQLVQKGQTMREREMEEEFKQKEVMMSTRFKKEREDIIAAERAKQEELKQQNKILISAIETNERIIEDKNEQVEHWSERMKKMKEREDAAMDELLKGNSTEDKKNPEKAKYDNFKSSVAKKL